MFWTTVYLFLQYNKLLVQVQTMNKMDVIMVNPTSDVQMYVND